jgi:LuxR family maltose regulon positive regulatory protein
VANRATEQASPAGLPADRTILRTKLHPPPLRGELIAREALLAALAQHGPQRLTVVSAPPGFGKSTLLAQWAASTWEPRPFAWVSLDRGDNDPVRFWSYVVESLQPLAPALEQIRRHLIAPGDSLVELVLPELVNELESAPQPGVLVLDDYHAITNRDIHEAVAMLIDHLPSTLHLVVATRSDPPFALANLRARGDLREVRASELRFNEEESATLLNGVFELGLSKQDVDTLQRRTEGWAAGLYLAALSLQGRSETEELIRSFAGTDRHIVDYLGVEVLESQDDDVRSFLLGTSILSRFCAPLCDALLERTDSAPLLRQIEASNLFLVPLDRTRTWYRYHHLFGELLKHELVLREPALVATLHRRASAWHVENGTPHEAIDHALASGDLTAASDLIALHWNAFQNLGRLQTVAGWLDEVPEDFILADARLCLARTGNALTLGRRDEVEPWADAALNAPLPDGPRVGAASVEAEANVYRAVRRYMVGSFDSAREAASRAVELETNDESPWRAMACAALGRTLFWLGDYAESERLLQEAIRFSQPGANTLSVTGALGYLAVISADHGRVAEAQRLSEEALALSSENGFGEHFVTMPARVAEAKVSLKRGDRLDADAAAARAVEVSERGAGPVERAFALVVHADVRRALDDRAGSVSLAASARRWIEQTPEHGILDELLSDIEESGLTHSRVRLGDRDELSQRELAVLRLLPTQLSLREIGSALYVSQNTVKTHAKNIYRKLGVSNRADAIARARELDLI